MSKSNILSVLAAASVLLGCSAYKNYESPGSSALPQLYQSADSTGIGQTCWQEFFTEEQLRACIAAGLQNNLDLQAAALRVEQYRQACRAARLAYLPSLELSPAGNYAYSKERYGDSAYGWSLPFTASWEADIAGRTTAAKKIAQADLEQSEVWRCSVETELIASIAEAYYTLALLDRKLDISRKTSASWQENVRIMKAMKQAGMANEASVSQTEAGSLSIETSIFDLERQLAEAENRMSLLLGQPPTNQDGSTQHARGSLKDVSLPQEIATGVPAQLLAHRPDVMAAELELRKAYYQTAAARAELYPSLRLNGSAGWEKALTLDVSGLAASLAASLVQPVFSAGRLKARVETAKIRQEEALAAFEQSILKAGAEVNDAIAQCNAARSKKELRIQQIEALETAEESTRELMRHSEATYLEVLTAQQSLLNARLLQATDRFEEITAIIALYKALGGR